MEHIGKYIVLSVLGRGAMGVVYKARDPEIDRIVAIKTLRKILPAELKKTGTVISRFITEARSAGRLRHQHIITIFDISLEGEVPFIVMDYVEGETLSSVLSKSKKIDIDIAIKLLSQAAKALDYAHSQDVLHKDIKPGNLLIDKQGNLYILDFGIASIGESISKYSAGEEIVMGTPGYMAPEQALMKKLTKKVDIFSLGVVAFEMLSGTRPFEGSDFTTAIQSLVNSRPKSIVSINPAIPIAVESVFERVLAKTAEIRYNSAIEFVEDLAKALGIKVVLEPDTAINEENDLEKIELSEDFEETYDSLEETKNSSKLRNWTITIAIFCILMLLFIANILLDSSEDTDFTEKSRALDSQTLLNAGVGEKAIFKLPDLVDVDIEKKPGDLSSIELLSLIADSKIPEDKVVNAIEESSERSIPFLLEGLVKAREHASYVVREKAILAIGSLKDKRATSILLESLDDYDSRVRLAAAKSLAMVANSNIVQYLEVKKSRESSAAVKNALDETIRRLKVF
ncbi:MAG: protein kinase [Bdellovibrionales bacterium]|nr:protein kinase [Bdellovibrionales bacterium]